MRRVEGVIFDWAGTTVDFGCFAPINVFIDIFKNAGIDVTMEEARKPMGMLKIDHIRTMLEMDRIRGLWREVYGREFTEKDVEELHSKFETILLESLSRYTEPIPEVLDTIKYLRENDIKVGSTTGYTNSMMDIVTKGAKENGYEPDFWITADSTNSCGRPYPYMIFKNLEQLKISSVLSAIKIGDTESDIREGKNAGVWTVGVAVGSSTMGLSYEEFISLSEEEKEELIQATEKKFLEWGADFTIRTMGEIEELIEKINTLISEGKSPKK
ncbi:phosphonoacetaldehyde hydrolase [Clostridium perfringens]|nr:phosphonoacetaldehyde hydrolase [Clostridium perfringens]